MTEVISEVEPAPVFDLDLEQLGTILRRLPAISARAGHKSPRATLGYVAASTPEAEFVRDVFSLSTPEMIEKWYGGDLNAGRYAAEVSGAVLATRRKGPAA